MQRAKQGTCHGETVLVCRQLSIKIETSPAFSMAASFRQASQDTNGVRRYSQDDEMSPAVPLACVRLVDAGLRFGVGGNLFGTG